MQVGRRGTVKAKKIKQPKVGNEMYGNEFYGINYVAQEASNAVKITDTKSSKHFGILLSTQQAIEEFQQKSGMLKAFTTEYQFHYWALVARISIDNEILDIAIPTVLFNYDQTVDGSAVDFHLTDVEEASTRNQPIADTIADVLVNSSFGKFLQEMFKESLEWMSVPMNTCHVHPGQLSTFSGTDYAKTPNDPGICFPLAEPHGQPSFSSIICHQPSDGNIGKVLRTEYRHATRVENEIRYLHGTCLAYWRGHTVKGYQKKLPLLQSIFSNKEFDYKEDIVKPGYLNIDGTVVLESNELLNRIIKEFDAIEFSPHTEDVVADRIQKSVYKHKSVYGYQQPKTYGNTHNKTPAYSSGMSLVEMREELISEGYSSSTVYTWDFSKTRSMYENMKDVKRLSYPAKAQASLFQDDDKDDNDMTIDEKIKFMLANGIAPELIRGKTTVLLDLMFEDLMEAIEEAEEKSQLEELAKTDTVNFKTNPKVIEFLNKFGVDETTISAMTNEDVLVLLEELNF